MRANSLKISYFVGIFLICLSIFASAEPPADAPYFEAQKGFKPAQRNFQSIFLQMAESFEQSGSPAGYLRHVNAEAKRVEAAWLKAKGKPAQFRPEYFTEDYIEKLIVGWGQMERVLALQSFTRNSGKRMRYAILGTEKVPPSELAAFEQKLSEDEVKEYQRFLGIPSFRKSDLPSLEKFYADNGAFDKLSEEGKIELNKRVWRGTMDSQQLSADLKDAGNGTIILPILGRHQLATVAGIEGQSKLLTSEDLKEALIDGLILRSNDLNLEKFPAGTRDAISYSHAIKRDLDERLARLRKQASPQQMKSVEEAINLMMENLLVAARLEFESGLRSNQLGN